MPRYIHSLGATVRFVDAAGDRGTEIHVELASGPPAGRLGEIVQRVRGSVPLAKVKDELRHFKQRVETGEITRSEAVPEGERLERKFKRRPAQPWAEGELHKASV